MADIPQFRAKWNFYRTRAHLISPHFGAGETITQDAVARRIPRDVGGVVPATDDDGIAGAAFGNWLATEVLPDNRIRQWEELTRIPIAIWTGDLAGFERTARQRAGEVLGWRGLVERRAVRGRIRVSARDRDPAPQDRQPAMRFYQDGVDPDERTEEVQLVWPNCIANILVSSPEPRGDEENRRAWLLADYGPRVFVLDPAQPAHGPAPSSRIDRAAWRSGRREGHIVLPRGAPGYVWLPPSIPLGTRFEVIVLVLNLGSQPVEVRSLFDAMERRCLVNARETLATAYQETVRSTLEEAAAVIEAHDVGHVLHAQRCEVVDRATALEGRRG